MKTVRNLYGMKLHETRAMGDGLYVMRVPGGWIYNQWVTNNDVERVQSTFVPYCDEFQEVLQDE